MGNSVGANAHSATMSINNFALCFRPFAYECMTLSIHVTRLLSADYKVTIDASTAPSQLPHVDFGILSYLLKSLRLLHNGLYSAEKTSPEKIARNCCSCFAQVLRFTHFCSSEAFSYNRFYYNISLEFLKAGLYRSIPTLFC